MVSSLPQGGLAWHPCGNTSARSQRQAPLRNPSHRPTRHQPYLNASVPTVASPCSSSRPSLPFFVVLHEHPACLPLTPDHSDSWFPAVCLFVFLLLPSRLDFAPLHLQKDSFSMYNDLIIWWICDWAELSQHRLALYFPTALSFRACSLVQLGLMRRRSPPLF